MSYIVSHHASYEPSGHHNYPDKKFENLEDAQKYYNDILEKCKANAETRYKKYPELYASESMREEIFRVFTKDYLDEWELSGFLFQENYALHTFMLEEF